MRLISILFFCLALWPVATWADCVNPPGEEGVMVYNTTYKTMQFCNGTHWVGMAGGISGDNSLTGEEEPWQSVDLADTSDFDTACQYKFRMGANWVYPHTITPAFLLFDVSTAAFKFGAIEKGSKNQHWTRDEGNVGVTGGTPAPVDEMHRKCVIDKEPDNFSFTDIIDVAFDTLVTSDPITVTGFNTEVPVTVSGEGNPEISINGGAWVTSGAILYGQTLQVRLTSAGAFSTSRKAIVNMGGVEGEWNVSTPGDIPCGSLGNILSVTALSGVQQYTSRANAIAATGYITCQDGSTVNGISNIAMASSGSHCKPGGSNNWRCKGKSYTQVCKCGSYCDFTFTYSGTVHSSTTQCKTQNGACSSSGYGTAFCTW